MIPSSRGHGYSAALHTPLLMDGSVRLVHSVGQPLSQLGGSGGICIPLGEGCRDNKNCKCQREQAASKMKTTQELQHCLTCLHIYTQ
jgi:hypothetical protein